MESSNFGSSSSSKLPKKSSVCTINYSSPIKNELSNILERQLNASKPMSRQTHSACNYYTTSPTIPTNDGNTMQHNKLPGIAPNKPQPRRRLHQSERLNENEMNRLLFKEMVERNRGSRRLSNSMANENNVRRKSSPTSPNDCLILDTGRSQNCINGLPNLNSGLPENVFTISSVQTIDSTTIEEINTDGIRNNESEISSIRDLPEEPITMGSENEARNSTTSDLIRFPSDASINNESIVVEQSQTPLDLAQAHTIDILEEFDPEIINLENIQSDNIVSQRTPAIAASSHSLDSFLQSASSISTRYETTAIGQSQSASSLSANNIYYDDSPGELKIGNKVVWFTPNGSPVTGVVKWVGKLKERYHAGVEFDKAIGNSSGLYNGKRLFTCSLTHGRFVPVSELILHLDFYSGSCSNEPSPFSCGIPTDDSIDGKNNSGCNELPIVCVICHDPLLTPIVAEEADSSIVQMNGSNSGSVSTKKEIVKKLVGKSSERDKNNKNHITNNKEMVTTKCGHLFHSECLTQWFSLKSRINQPCPYCQNLMNIQDTIRIFPVQGIP